jgi:hypothetical protein
MIMNRRIHFVHEKKEASMVLIRQDCNYNLQFVLFRCS